MTTSPNRRSAARSTSRVSFKFDARKAAETASRFTELAGGTIDVVRLMKLLYLSERRSLELHRRPIFGDRYVAMKHGPVVSHSYNLLKSDPDEKSQEAVADVELWSTHFGRDGYQVRLQERLAPAALSRADLEVIESVHEQWFAVDTWAMVDKLHLSLAEWRHPGRSMTPIPIEGICAALKMGDGEMDDVREQARADWATAKALGC